MLCGLLINRRVGASAAMQLALLVFAAAVAGGQAGPPPPDPQLTNRDLSIRPVQSPKPLPSVPRGYALVIGISKYEKIDPAQNLQFPESDSQGIYRSLISKEAGNVPAENVHRLIGPQATKANIQHELEDWLPSVVRDGDTVIVFFAGHGFAVNGRGYFAPWDVDPDNIVATGYSMSEFGRALETKVKAKNKILLIDACRSGKVGRGLTDSPASQSEVNASLGKLSNSFLTFVAAREQDSSFEDPKLGSGAGLFSYFVIRGLEGEADQSPCDGVVTADELIEYVRTNVREYARDHGESQTPIDYGDFNPKLVLSLSHKCGTTVTANDVSVGDLVVEGNMDGIEIYLDGQPVGSVSKGKALRLPGIATGVHTVMGVLKGYEADTKQVPVVPGQERSVTMRIQYPRQFKKNSKALMEQGEKLLFSHRSSFNPLAIYTPVSQNRKTFEQAELLFERSLEDDPKNARSAYDLGMTFLYLSKDSQSLAALQRAITIDPTYIDAKTQCAGELIESGDPDEAIRQLTDVLRVEPKNDIALSYLSRAYYDKFVWDKSIEAANQALQIKSENEQSYLWKGSALRMLAARQTDSQRKLELYQQSSDCFQTFVRLTTFSRNGWAELAYFSGIVPGLGYRSHADRTESYSLQRSIAFEGLCDAENKLGHSIRAEDYCKEAIDSANKDPMAYYLLGHVYRDRFAKNQVKGELLLARDNYQQVVSLNPDLEISKNARNYLDQIQALLETLAKRSQN
jgi:tetratricopeptide (TPR) repeat protein